MRVDVALTTILHLNKIAKGTTTIVCNPTGNNKPIKIPNAMLKAVLEGCSCKLIKSIKSFL